MILHNSACSTKQIDVETGQITIKNKLKYDSLNEAINIAKRMNMEDDRVMKVVAYKCQKCHFYHVGKNGSLLTKKYKNKLKNQ